MKDDLRDYGLPPAGKPTGIPTWKKLDEPLPCPNCGGELVEVSVPVAHPLLKGGQGITTYLGCPACPFASPAISRAGGAS